MHTFKSDLINAIALAAFLLLFLALSQIANADTVNSNNTNTSTIDQDIKTNVGNTSTWSQTQTSSNNGNNWENKNIDSYNTNNINNAQTYQSIDNSYYSKTDNTTTVKDNNIGANAGGSVNNDSSAAGGSASQGQNQQQKQGQFTQTGAVNVAPSYINHQVRQTPMAWAPNMAMSASQENCNNSASLGVSAGFGAISGGVPINDNDCTRRRDAILWANLGQMRIACERMAQDDGNKAAMKSAGVTCGSITPVAAIVAPLSPISPLALDTERRLNSIKPINTALDSAHTTQMIK